jgi:hypothetical protein
MSHHPDTANNIWTIAQTAGITAVITAVATTAGNYFLSRFIVPLEFKRHAEATNLEHKQEFYKELAVALFRVFEHTRLLAQQALNDKKIPAVKKSVEALKATDFIRITAIGNIFGNYEIGKLVMVFDRSKDDVLDQINIVATLLQTGQPHNEERKKLEKLQSKCLADYDQVIDAIHDDLLIEGPKSTTK